MSTKQNKGIETNTRARRGRKVDASAETTETTVGEAQATEMITSATETEITTATTNEETTAMTTTTTTTITARNADVIRAELAQAQAEHDAAKASGESYKVKQAKVKRAKGRVRSLTSELAGYESGVAADALNAKIVAVHEDTFKKFGFAPSSTPDATGAARVVLTTAAGIPMNIAQAEKVLALFIEFGFCAPKPVEPAPESSKDGAQGDDAAPESTK